MATDWKELGRQFAADCEQTYDILVERNGFPELQDLSVYDLEDIYEDMVVACAAKKKGKTYAKS